jgi:hypothetical protein
MSSSNRNGSSSASGSATASLASCSAVVNRQNVTGEVYVASQSFAVLDRNQRSNYSRTGGGRRHSQRSQFDCYSAGIEQRLQPTSIWTLSANAMVASPFGEFSLELAMRQLSSQVNSLPVADYMASSYNPTPYCLYSCGTGLTRGSGFMSGTGVLTFTPITEIPVDTTEDDPDATLAGVSFTDNGVPVTDFTLTT